MDGTMSQEEINALLNSPTVSDEEGHKELLSERDRCDRRDRKYQYGNGCNNTVFSGQP